MFFVLIAFIIVLLIIGLVLQELSWRQSAFFLGASAFCVWLVCCGVGLGVSISRAEQAQDFDHPNSYLSAPE